ncbi:MAG: 50S ribosomal protein L18 [Ignavibacteriales bacterium]|nr:MAG: 50S ribosomal protein L18 [Ignavibacteriales bacterium]
MIRNQSSRQRAKFRIRKKIFGTPERPRMTVYRSLSQIYVQLVDDINGKTLISASTLSKEVVDQVKSAKGKTSKSKLVGTLVAKKAVEGGISNVIFDRNGYKYHGRVKALADSARENGLKF